MIFFIIKEENFKWHLEAFASELFMSILLVSKMYKLAPKMYITPKMYKLAPEMYLLALKI